MVEEVRKKKLERLETLKLVLENKKQMAADFKQKYDIEFDVLFNPKHEKFNQLYALEEEQKENLVMAIKLKSATRSANILGTFVIYHAAKFVLWRFGYFATFFKSTRFMTFPILGFAVYMNLKNTMHCLNDAGVLDYNQRRVRFDRDSRLVEKVLKSR